MYKKDFLFRVLFFVGALHLCGQEPVWGGEKEERGIKRTAAHLGGREDPAKIARQGETSNQEEEPPTQVASALAVNQL